ncbi:BrnA antitoxin family protein [Jannaschia sp. M317]|uniref:BrnA antitoxin family protein n=1 Tax=Jannaschia sp. M317 TaxID=2867011 RepID=UPI0021A950A4|nr:BrnA antitoxin family protein [Jannaschia sp. M317]UWQ19222.1 BrnA antitoxin family protein [Jannaschia sp. M317]
MATQRQARAELFAIMDRFQWDLANRATREGKIPSEWRRVWTERSSRKRKVSLWVDEDVYRLFKSMGHGMGPRMNAVLGAFVRARVAGMLEGEDLSERFREEWMGKPKPSADEAVAEWERSFGE